MPQGLFGSITISQDGKTVTKHVKSTNDTKVYQNEIRIMKVLQNQKTPSSQGWIPRNTEWNASQKTLTMQRLPFSEDTVKNIFPKNASVQQKTQFRLLVKNALRDLGRLHRVVLHMDLHTENMMIRETIHRKTQERQYQLVFIDFGMSLLLSDVKRYFQTPIITLLKKMEKYHVYMFFKYSCPHTWQQQILNDIFTPVPSFTEEEEHMYDDIHDFCILLVKQGRFL